jgi:hypothetical protein
MTTAIPTRNTTTAPRRASDTSRPRLARLRRFLLTAALPIALPFAIPLAALAADPMMAGHDHADMHGPIGGSPLLEKVRDATRRYRDINIATGEGWVQATPCVSGPNEGAMGVHFLKPDRLMDGQLKADEPEMLIYEPLPGGRYRLVGVEYIVLASDWFSKHKPSEAPSVDGHLANFVGEPNRYALPAFFEMHAWAWEDNPNGSFSDWNSRVTCNRALAPAN